MVFNEVHDGSNAANCLTQLTICVIYLLTEWFTFCKPRYVRHKGFKSYIFRLLLITQIHMYFMFFIIFWSMKAEHESIK